MSQLLEKLNDCVKQSDLYGANISFLSHFGKRSLLELTEASDLESASFFLDNVLPLTLHDYPSILVENPELLTQYRVLLDDAKILGYSVENLKRYRQRLRCVEAISSIFSGKQDRILLASEENGYDNINLNIDRTAENLSLNELENFFADFFETARKHHDERTVKELSGILFDILARLKREETVPGIARGLFVDGVTGKGEVRRVLARVELGEGAIEYATLISEEISDSLKGASKNAWIASNSYLVDNGYSEGLRERKITWQITDLDVRADQLKTFYDGSSMGLPLSMAIISAYLQRPIPSSVAFTGAFDIASAREGRLIKVGGVVNKSKVAIENGFKSVFLPRMNEVDIDLSLQKEAEREDFSLSFVESVADACQEMFGDSRKKTAYGIVRDVLSELWGILTLRPKKDFFRENIAHVWGSSLLVLLMFFIEGMLVYKVSSTVPVSWSAFWISIIPASIIVFLAILTSYGIVPIFLEQQRQDSWYMSLLVFGIALIAAYFLFILMVKGETPDLSRFPDWPAPLGILKDFFIFYAFFTFYLSNIFNNIAALDFLLRRHQVVTVRNSIESPKIFGPDLPVKLLSISWNWAVITAMVVGILLFTYEMITYWSLKEGVVAAKWFIMLGILRDLVLVILAVETLIWYRNCRGNFSRKVSRI